MDNVNPNVNASEKRESPRIVASMEKLIPERKKGERFDGGLDVNIVVGESVIAGLEISAGDCARDGVVPSASAQAELAERRKQRKLLKGRNISGQER